MDTFIYVIGWLSLCAMAGGAIIGVITIVVQIKETKDSIKHLDTKIGWEEDNRERSLSRLDSKLRQRMRAIEQKVGIESVDKD